MRDLFKKNYKLILSLLSFLLLIILRDIFSLSITFGLFSLLMIVSSILLNKQDRMALVCALLPFCRGLPYSEMLLINLIVTFLLNIKKQKLKIRLYLQILAITIIELIDYFVFSISSIEIVYLAVYMITATFINEQDIFEGAEEKIGVIYAISTQISILVVVLREMKLLGWEYITVYGVRFGSNTGGRIVTNYNSNELGLYCIVGVSLLLFFYSEKKNSLYLLLALVSSASGFVSVSRSYLMVLLFTWGMYFIYSKKSYKSILLFAAAVTVVIIFIQFAFPELSKWLLNYYRLRNLQAGVDGLGGRYKIITNLFDKYFDSSWSVLFGYSELYTIVLGTVGAHNGLQEMLISWGLVGFIISFVWIISLLRNSKKTFDVQWKAYTPFISFIIFIMSLQLFTMHNYLILMSLSMVTISYFRSNTYSSVN